ncbi:MAG: hypothetical protein M3Q36_04325 [bacterium]|nr:hypothetical protein [bacterium]
MGRYITAVPNMNHVVMIKGVRLVSGVRDVGVRGSRFVAIIDEGLDGGAYETLAVQVRLVYGFSFQCAVSDSYQIMASTSGYHYTGHNERKNHLLQRTLFPTQKFVISSGRIFEDLLTSKQPAGDMNIVFNLFYLWVRAKELRELHLPQEAELLLWKIVEHMQQRGTNAKGKKLLKKLNRHVDDSSMFAAKVLSTVGSEKRRSVREELEALINLDKLRQKQDLLAAGKAEHYLEQDAALAAEQRNVFISEIARLYIIWQCGLTMYYLKQKGDIYKVARSNPTEKTTSTSS